jgi:GxxExxY protein
MSTPSSAPPHLPESDMTQTIIGCAMEVHNELGSGFLEVVYRRALALVISARGIRLDAEPGIPVVFRGQIVGKFYPDLVVDRRVIVEVKAQSTLDPKSEAQLLNYLKAAGGGVGLLLNFGRRFEFKRRVHGDATARLPALSRADHG